MGQTKRWTVPLAAIFALAVMAPWKRDRDDALLAEAESFARRMAADVLIAARRAQWDPDWPTRISLTAWSLGPRGEPLRFSPGRTRWTAGRITKRMYRWLGHIPSRPTLLAGLDILVEAGAIHRFEDRRTYVFVKVPSGPDLTAVPAMRAALHLRVGGVTYGPRVGAALEALSRMGRAHDSDRPESGLLP